MYIKGGLFSMEKIISEFVATLDGKVSDQDLCIVKNQMILFFRDYDITKKEWVLQPTPWKTNLTL